MKNKLEKISNYIFYAGVIVAVYGLYKSFISRRGLPPGVCPIEDNRPKIYLALVLLLASVIISFIKDKKFK